MRGFSCVWLMHLPAGRYTHSSGPLRAPAGHVRLCIGVNPLFYFMFVVAHVYLPNVMS